MRAAPLPPSFFPIAATRIAEGPQLNPLAHTPRIGIHQPSPNTPFSFPLK
jgi:hypothetical protein